MIKYFQLQLNITFISTLVFLLFSCAEKGITLKEPNAVVSTFAGGSGSGLKDGPIKDAQFNSPLRMAITSNDVLYLIDQNGMALRKIEGDFVSTIISNQNPPEFYALAVNLSNEVFVAQGDNIYKVIGQNLELMLEGHNTNPDLSFSGVDAISFGPNGDLYIAEHANNRIMKYTASGIMSIFAGGKNDYLDGPIVEAALSGTNILNVQGNELIYIADAHNSKIRKISNGYVTTIAGIESGFYDGPAETSKFHWPWSIAIKEDGILYIADQGNKCIRRLNEKEKSVTTVAGDRNTSGYVDGVNLSARFYDPTSIVFTSSGSLLVCDPGNNCIRRITFE